MFNDFVGQKKQSFTAINKQKRYSFQPLNTRQRSFDRNKIAFYHNLSKKQCTQITETDQRQNTQQQLDELYKKRILQEASTPYNPNNIQQKLIKVICKYRRSNSKDQKIEIIEKDNNRLELYDQKTFIEVECDHIFLDKHPNLNKEIWNLVKEGIDDSFDKKQYYTLIIHGASKTGKNLLLLNKSLLNLHNSTMQIDDHIIDNNAGLLERTVNHLLLKYDVKEYEVLISVIGFTEEKAIDLLNLEQDISGSYFTLLKIKKDQKNLMVENLIQMGIRNIAEYIILNSLNTNFITCCLKKLADFLKKQIFEELGVKITSTIYQVVVAKMSNDRETIHQVIQKFNFVKISNCQQTALQRSNLNYCIERVASHSNQFIPYKDSKLTSFLEDTLTKQSTVQIIPCITDQLSVKSQMPTLSIVSSAQKHTQHKKHYFHDPEIVAKVYTQDILEVKDIVSQFENGENIMVHTQEVQKTHELPYLANNEDVKKFLGVSKNNRNLQEYKSSAMLETESFVQKRVIRSNSQLVDNNKEMFNTQGVQTSNKENFKQLSAINKSLNIQNQLQSQQQTLLDFKEQFKPFSMQATMIGLDQNHGALRKKLSSCERSQQIYRKQYYKQKKIYLEPLSNTNTKRSNSNSFRQTAAFPEDKKQLASNGNL